MLNEAIEIELRGEVYKSIIIVSGIEIQLLETEEHIYKRRYEKFATDGFLDLMMHIVAIEGTSWQLNIKMNQLPIYQSGGTIGPQGYTTLKELIKID